MRKMYIQPKNEISKVESMMIMAGGSGVLDETPEQIGGQAPERATKVY